MAASREDISGWFDRAKAKGATHMLVVCDTFDWDDYPVEVMPGQDVRKIAEQHNGPNMTKLMEVYALHADKTEQMNKRRCFNYDAA